MVSNIPYMIRNIVGKLTYVGNIMIKHRKIL